VKAVVELAWQQLTMRLIVYQK